MTGPRRPDRAERLLSLATTALPARRAEWGAAMRAELAAIEDAEARRRFARSAAAAAFSRGPLLSLVLILGPAVVTAAATVAASRVQLAEGGPGVMLATVPVPALLLFAVAAIAAAAGGSVRAGLVTGALALVACFVSVAATVALEGFLWMEQRGIWVLDADPPRGAVSPLDVVLDFFSTGIWAGHLAFWLLWPVLGALLGAWLGRLITYSRVAVA